MPDIEATGKLRDTEEMIVRLGRILDASPNEIYMFDAETLRFMLVNSADLSAIWAMRWMSLKT